MTDQLQLRDWQQICQAKAAHYAGTPEGMQFLVESNRYGMAADHIAELTRIIASQREEADHVNGESAHMLQAKAAEIIRLKAELAQAKIYMPAQRATLMSAPATVAPCNLAAWGILVESDEEFEARAGTQIAEVAE